MRSYRLLLAVGIVLASFQACDIVDDPTPPGPGSSGGPSQDFSILVDSSGYDPDLPAPTRKVLLEDITGHRCNNCPRAARIAQGLKDDLYGEDLVLVGVHAGGFAAPYEPIGDGFYDTDHRTAAGITYQQNFQVFFFPAGLVSRKPFEESTVVSEGSWSAAVADIIGGPSSFELRIDSIAIEEGLITTVVRLHLAEQVDGDFNLVVYLVEDEVIDWQLDSEASPPDVPDYHHRHMLRANLNDTWGTNVINTSASGGRVITTTISNYSLDPTWDVDHLYVVAYVYDVDTDEVLQAEERKFQP
ncbi:MAG TPA: Omp28-related outer membrane protein [Flavobacteriales bacterium]|nr:Omp28-related outer membrane protein [Flavobacteriales bacterium]